MDKESVPGNLRLARHGSRWRSSRAKECAELAEVIEQLGHEAVDDPKMLTDLRSLRRILEEVCAEAADGSPVVRERRRRAQITVLERQLAELRK